MYKIFLALIQFTEEKQTKNMVIGFQSEETITPNLQWVFTNGTDLPLRWWLKRKGLLEWKLDL